MEVKIEKLVYGRDGLAHQEGQTVFVPLVLPGELVSIAPAERKKKFVRGRLERVVEAAPERVAAPCPYFGRCGGCHYQHIPYDAQIRYKLKFCAKHSAGLAACAGMGRLRRTLLRPSVTAIARSGKFERRKMARPRRQGSATSKPVAHAFAPWMNARFFRPGSAKHWPNCVRWLPAKLFPR